MHCKYTWCTLARSLISLTSVIALTPRRISCRNTRGHILARGYTNLISLIYKWGGTLGRSLTDARVISQRILYHRRHISNRGLLGLIFNRELARLVYLSMGELSEGRHNSWHQQFIISERTRTSTCRITPFRPWFSWPAECPWAWWSPSWHGWPDMTDWR